MDWNWPIITGVCLLLLGALWVHVAPSDPYGLFHLELNRLGDEPDHHLTEWMNMGYWKVRVCSTFASSHLMN
jgi:hypothetical protein